MRVHQWAIGVGWDFGTAPYVAAVHAWVGRRGRGEAVGEGAGGGRGVEEDVFVCGGEEGTEGKCVGRVG